MSPKKEIDNSGYSNSPPKLDAIATVTDYNDEPEDLSMPKTKIQKLLKEESIHSSSSPFSMSPSSSPSVTSRVSTPPMSGNPPWMDEVWEWYSTETKKRILVRSDVHNKGVSLNIGTEISKSWVKVSVHHSRFVSYFLIFRTGVESTR